MAMEEWSWHMGLGLGLKDSIFGIGALWHVPTTTTQKEESGKSKTISTLERRRQQKRQETVKEHFETKRSEGRSMIIHRVLQCMVLNGGVVCLSILFFNHLVTPLLMRVIQFISEYLDAGNASSQSSVVWSWTRPVLNFTFNALWILPIFLLSRIINAIWFQDIADATYRLTRGRPLQLPSLSRNLADVLFSLVVETLFLIQATLIKSLLPIPTIANFFYFLHLCLLYALYSFEYKWFNMGWDVVKRLDVIETSWPYYFGFGLPLASLSGGFIFPVSYVVSGCIFSVLFPLFIIAANPARPTAASGTPLRLFFLAVAATNKIFAWKTQPRPQFRPQKQK